jgi:hypothetical protein
VRWGVSLGIVLAGCCFAPSRPAAATARVEVRVPADVIAARSSELPFNLFARRVPGELEHRGVLLATICEAEDVVTTYDPALEGPTEIVFWLDPTYANSPITPCGLRSDRNTMIADQPRDYPQASIRIDPGARGDVVLGPPPAVP